MKDKLRTKPRGEGVNKDTIKTIPAIIVCLALSVFSLIAYFYFDDFPIYGAIGFSVMTAVAVLYAVLGKRRFPPLIWSIIPAAPNP